jgi:SET domain-containing protein
MAIRPSHVTSRVTVERSRVHGRGVFAKKPFRNGDRIIEYTGRRILWSKIPDELDDPRMYYFGIGDGKWVIDPSVGGNEARLINHSCDPNCEIRETRGRIFIHALRNIRPGEELFYDYHLETDDDVPRTKEIEAEAPCHCGSPNCRGTLLAARMTRHSSLPSARQAPHACL